MSENEQLVLEDIPGLGPVRRSALAEAGIEDLRALLSKTVAELAAVRGIGIWQARKIHEYLRQRSLSLQEDAGDAGAVIVAGARTDEDVAALVEAVSVLEHQAGEEAALEAEVEVLMDAVAEAERHDGDVRASEIPSEEQELLGSADTQASDTEEDEDEEAEDGDRSEDEESDDEEQSEGELVEEIRAQREQLPETALALMEAIRQAAVSRQLTRQLTRLLICSGEFVSGGRELSTQQRRRAQEILARVDRVLQRAVEKQSFSPAAQKELASRIRKRRKQLEELLEK